MALGRSDPEQKAAKLLEKERREAARQEEKERRDFRAWVLREQAAFQTSPAGRARAAFARGDQVFQYGINLMSQQAIIVPMVGGTTTQQTADPSAILNSVCAEGWELVNGGFVFVQTGQESRDKFLSSGQNVAVSGATVGYYLFRRSESSKVETVLPWETEEALAFLAEDSG